MKVTKKSNQKIKKDNGYVYIEKYHTFKIIYGI